MTDEHPNPGTPEEVDAPAPEAETETQDTETFEREYVEKLRAENAKWRNKFREREEREKEAAEAKRQAELSAEERAKEAERKAQEAVEAAEKRVQTAERRAALAGKVSNPERVLRLMDDPDEYFDGATPDVEKILTDYSEYRPDRTNVELPSSRSTKGAPATNPWATDTRNLTEQARILKENPTLARQLKDAAGVQ